MIPVRLTNDYKESMMKMGRFVEDLFDKSVYSLINRDADMARKIIKDDEIADGMRNDLVEKSLCLIGEYSPVGKHLVEIASGIAVAGALEMIGDRAKTIAKNTIELVKEPMLKALVDIPKMASTVMEMLRISLSVYFEEKTEKLSALLEMEAYVDDLSSKVEDELKLYMMESPKNVGRALRLVFIARSIEEVSDLCFKIFPRRR